MKKLKHSKLRNSYLIFETLCRFAMTEISNQDKGKSVRLITKYFNEDTPLGRELSLYEALGNFTQQGETLDVTGAKDLISLTLEMRNSMDPEILKRTKYRLISEINEIYGKDLFNEELNKFTSTYKVAASIYKLFEYGDSTNPRDLLRCRDTVVGVLTEKVSNSTPFDELDVHVHGKVVDLMYNKFETKYAGLNESQKEFLSKVATGTLDTEYLNSVLNTVESKITTELTSGAITEGVSGEMLATIRTIDTVNPDVNKLQLLVMLMGD